MLEWNISEDKEPLPSDPPEPSPRAPFNRRTWFTLFLVLLLVGIGVSVGVWWRARAVDEQMRNDLLIFIRREEQARRFGLVAQAEQFIAQQVPGGWRDRYEATFTPPTTDAISVTIGIADVEFAANEAVVQVQVGRQLQERRYRQTEQGWRRVPLGLQTEGSSKHERVGDTIFTFSTPNEAFARAVIEDYPRWIALWGEWEGRLPEISTIGIHNEEFVRPAYVEADTLHVTNPAIVTLPAHWDLTGEEAVRYWMAREIGSRLTLGRLSPTFLPGNARFVNALVTVTSLRWAVADEPYARLVATWSELAATHRDSSFYDLPNHSQQIDPFAPTPQEAAALLIANTLYDQGGNEKIAELVRTMQGARQWDAVFSEVTGLNTLEFETLARGGPIPSAILEETPVRGVPIAVNRFQSFQLQVAGYEQPIWVQTTLDTKVLLSDGREVDAACATVFPEVEIEGEWYESGLRLEATRIVGVVASDSPRAQDVLVDPAPPDTLYYFARSQSDADGNGTTQLVAVNAQNTLTPVWSRPVLEFAPMYSSFSQRSLPLKGITALGSESWDCNLRWLLRYDPESGEEVAWFFPALERPTFGDSKFLWDEARGLGMVAMTISGQEISELHYALVNLNQGSSTLNFAGTLPLGEAQLMRPGHNELLIYDYTANELVLYDWERELITWELPSEERYLFSSNFFDPTGRYLYLTITAFQEDPTNYLPYASKIVRYDLDSGESQLFWEEAAGGIAMAAIDANGSRLYAVVRLSVSGEIALMQYENGQWNALFRENPEMVLISNLKSCSKGGAVFFSSDVVEGEVTFPFRIEYHFITPDGNLGSTINSLDISDYPIAC